MQLHEAQKIRLCIPPLASALSWLFFIAPTYIATLILNTHGFLSQMRQLKACTAWLKEVQGMEAGDTTMQYPLLPCQFAALSFTMITSSAVLCTLTENSFATLCATLSHWIVSGEVTISFEVRVNFNNNFSEAKTSPHDPVKKLVFSLSGRSSYFTIKFWRQ